MTTNLRTDYLWRRNHQNPQVLLCCVHKAKPYVSNRSFSYEAAHIFTLFYTKIIYDLTTVIIGGPLAFSVPATPPHRKTRIHGYEVIAKTFFSVLSTSCCVSPFFWEKRKTLSSHRKAATSTRFHHIDLLFFYIFT